MVSDESNIKPASADALRRARRDIDGALTRDRGRLLGLLARWKAKPGDAGLRAAFARQAGKHRSPNVSAASPRCPRPRSMQRCRSPRTPTRSWH